MHFTLDQQWISRSAAFGLLGAGLLGGWMIAIQPTISQISEARDRLDEQRLLLGRLKTMSASKGAADELEQRTKSLDSGVQLIQGRTEAIRVAALQSLLTSMMTREGGQVRTTRALQSKEREGVRLIGVQVQMVSDIEQLQAILLQIEGSQTPLFADQLQAAVLPARGESTRKGVLDVRLDVFTPVLQSAE